MNEYHLKSVLYIRPDNFKEKDAHYFVNCISSTANLNDFITFNSYGNISFEENDHPHRYPIINELENFSRKTTNCLIFNIDKNYYKNILNYDKLIVYQTIGGKIDSCGFYLYNSDNKYSAHTYELTYAIDELIIAITKSFNTYYHMKDRILGNELI